MFPLNNKYIWPIFGALILALSACKTKPMEPVYNTPAPEIQVEDNKLYIKALNAQNAGRYTEAIELWEVFLKRHPDSHRGHNNLGRVYYLEDKLTQAVQEFETAHKLEPKDQRIRQNLAEVLRLQANLKYEDKKYDETIQLLTRLRDISQKNEKQGVQIQMEKVEDKIYEQVRGTDTIEGYREFVEHYPNGLNADRARQRLKELQTQSKKTTPQPEVGTVLPKTQSSMVTTKKKAPVITQEYLKEQKEFPKPVPEDQVDIVEEPLDGGEDKVEVKAMAKSPTEVTPFNKEAELYNTEKFGEEGSKEPVEVVVALPPEPVVKAPEKKEAVVVVKPKPENTPQPVEAKEPVLEENTDALLESLEKDIMEVLQPETQVPLETLDPKEELMVEPVPETTEPKPVDNLIEPFEKALEKEKPLEMAKAPVETQAKPKKETATKPLKKKSTTQTEPVTEKPKQLAKLPPDSKKKQSPKVFVQVTIKSGKLNVRSEPSTSNSEIIGKLKAGEKVLLLKETSDWFKVQFEKSKAGWIHRGFSKKLPPSQDKTQGAEKTTSVSS